MKVLLLVASCVAVSWASPCAQTTQNVPTEPTTIQTPTVWPLGSYGLPMSNSGCPGIGWKVGAFFQDTEDYYNGNTWNTTNMAGFNKKDGFLRVFCTMSDNTDSGAGSWPSGSYCILKKNACPAGFQEGSILWDDENNFNMNYIAVTDETAMPDGEYTDDTKLKYCCREDGDATTDIYLPTATPFYLLMKSDMCQSIAGMSVTVESIKWDDEDSNNHNVRTGSTPFDSGNPQNIGITYCYYTPTA